MLYKVEGESWEGWFYIFIDKNPYLWSYLNIYGFSITGERPFYPVYGKPIIICMALLKPWTYRPRKGEQCTKEPLI
jgi:hypothetical protein